MDEREDPSVGNLKRDDGGSLGRWRRERAGKDESEESPKEEEDPAEESAGKSWDGGSLGSPGRDRVVGEEEEKRTRRESGGSRKGRRRRLGREPV